jgi:hypothetical protein
MGFQGRAPGEGKIVHPRAKVAAFTFFGAIVAVFLAGTAQATPILGGPATLGIQVTPASGTLSVSSASLSLPWADINHALETTGHAEWALPSALPFNDADSHPLALLTGLTIQWDRDPMVNLSFSVQNLSDVPVNFTFNADVQTVSLTDPEAYASASFTLTDINHNGGAITGSFNGKAYRAFYNSTDFANLVGDFSVVADDSFDKNDRSPLPSGRTTIPGLVTSIGATFDFTLSPHDLASGTSNFFLTPEPATLALLGLGSLGLLRRRKK